MSRRLPSLNALRAFEAAARHLSFSRAADELCVTQSAVSRQIKALETFLGVPLFRRLTRVVELTDAGKEYLPTARDAFDRIEQATLRLMDHSRREVLTISVLPTLAMRWLIPRLPHFTAAHPDIEVRMITSIQPVNFGREDIDLAIRVGRPPESTNLRDGPRIDLEMVEDWTHVRAEMFMPDVLVPVCSPKLLSGPNRLRGPQDLPRHTLLHNATRVHAWPDWARAVGWYFKGMEKGPSFGHFFMCLQAAVEGRGIAIIPRALFESDLALGSLVMPFDLPSESSGAYYVLCRTYQWESDRIRRFREWLFSERDNPSDTTAPPRLAKAARAPAVATS